MFMYKDSDSMVLYFIKDPRPSFKSRLVRIKKFLTQKNWGVNKPVQ